MRALIPKCYKKSLISHLRARISLFSDPISIPIPLIPRIPPRRSLHDLPKHFTEAPNPSNSLLSSKILQSDPSPIAEAEEEDGPMNEFLSRFVFAIRPKLTAAFPDLARETLDAMLLLICQKVLAELDGAAAPAVGSVELSPDLWETVQEIANSVHEAMKKDRLREEIKKYLHCDEVKEMCRFAGDVGIRGDFLRELRFKWAREKLEEVEFYRELDRIRAQAQKGDENEGIEEENRGKPELTALPERKGRIKYKIYGLDLSDPKWAEVAERVEEAEKHIVPEEPKPIVGKSKKVDENILSLDAVKDDPLPVLEEWKGLVGPKRVDWVALLDRIKEKSSALYFKVAEHLLIEESFEAGIRDYWRLIDSHSKADCLKEAERILQKMIEKGITPDVLTCITLVHMYSKTGNLERTKEAFDSLRQQGFQPDFKVYNSMIMAYVKAGNPKSGESMAREMEARDIQPTKEIYMELLRAFAQQGQVDGAQRIVNTMEFSGIQRCVESSTLLVEAYGKSGDPDQARKLFDLMMKSGLKPDDRCTASMIRAYATKNQLDKALDLLLNLEKDGFRPGTAIYTVLVDWMGRLQMIEEAEHFLNNIREKGEDPPFEIHVSLCDMYCSAGIKEKTRENLKILEEKKHLLKADEFERIVSSLLDGGFVNDAKRMHNLMQAQGFPPSEALRVRISASQSIPSQRPSKSRSGKPRY
ncbi:pentatricopeptide repeat-containing protein At1g79540 [Dioscorea cayenensis subsp. rotundata]|uniref:Pentatricopeptide repeat-containing protein At1g79540 n=1 Tax=Dioscorea cayennensis subsp. rotundata TaxID=55577 RepID=A0AB40CVX3_DIOCR|nr:pentatricopeptide repeat-containing protein At1g79540 [Dioscorea cayenensis subsp. rotundata]